MPRSRTSFVCSDSLLGVYVRYEDRCLDRLHSLYVPLTWYLARFRLSE